MESALAYAAQQRMPWLDEFDLDDGEAGKIKWSKSNSQSGFFASTQPCWKWLQVKWTHAHARLVHQEIEVISLPKNAANPKSGFSVFAGWPVALPPQSQ